MRLDKKLNLVIPVTREGEETIYVHATPIAFDTYKTFSFVMSKAYAKIMSEGLTYISGPGIALIVLKDVAQDTIRVRGPESQSWWEGEGGVELSLLPEIRRLANLIHLQNGAWISLPLEIAYNQGLLSQEEVFEVENELAFFTVFSHSPPRSMRETLLDGMAAMFDSLTTSLNSTEYAASLPISTVVEISQASRSSVAS